MLSLFYFFRFHFFICWQLCTLALHLHIFCFQSEGEVKSLSTGVGGKELKNFRTGAVTFFFFFGWGGGGQYPLHTMQLQWQWKIWLLLWSYSGNDSKWWKGFCQVVWRPNCFDRCWWPLLRLCFALFVKTVKINDWKFCNFLDISFILLLSCHLYSPWNIKNITWLLYHLWLGFVHHQFLIDLHFSDFRDIETHKIKMTEYSVTFSESDLLTYFCPVVLCKKVSILLWIEKFKLFNNNSSNARSQGICRYSKMAEYSVIFSDFKLWSREKAALNI